MKTKRTRTIEKLPPVARKVYEALHSLGEPASTKTLASLTGLPESTVTPRMAYLDERGVGLIRLAGFVQGPARRVKAWECRGHNARLNTTRDGRLRRPRSYEELYLRERAARHRLVNALQLTNGKA